MREKKKHSRLSVNIQTGINANNCCSFRSADVAAALLQTDLCWQGKLRSRLIQRCCVRLTGCDCACIRRCSVVCGCFCIAVSGTWGMQTKSQKVRKKTILFAWWTVGKCSGFEAKRSKVRTLAVINGLTGVCMFSLYLNTPRVTTS